jgi:hypothetical protein
MMLKRRRIKWADGSNAANGFEVLDERGEKVGRVYRTITIGGSEAWRWSVYGIAGTNYPRAGLAPTREAAQAAFKAAWATCKPREWGA